jgi:hypothetical protein
MDIEKNASKMPNPINNNISTFYHNQSFTSTALMWHRIAIIIQNWDDTLISNLKKLLMVYDTLLIDFALAKCKLQQKIWGRER